MQRLALITAITVALGACGDDPLRPEPASIPRPTASVGAQSVTIRVSRVSAGDLYTCAVKLDGTLACWGADTWGQATPPTGTFTHVSVGSGHGCALRTDGTVACWGNNSSGQATPPAGTFTQVSVGGHHLGFRGHSCGLRPSGTVECWGDNVYGQATPPNPSSPFPEVFAQVSAGGGHTCGVRAGDGVVLCWGLNDWRQTLPVPALPFGERFTQVSAGEYHTCALEADGAVVCWGHDGVGSLTPPPVSFAQVSAGGLRDTPIPDGTSARPPHACAVRLDNSLACWGDNVWGQAAPPAGSFTQVSAGGIHSCAVGTDSRVTCWGNDGYGQSSPPLENRPPTASAGGPYAAVEGSTVALAWSASDLDGDALTYSWDFGDGTTGSGTSLPTSHTYADDPPGAPTAYTVTLTASDGKGGPATATATATIRNVAPNVTGLTIPTAPVQLLPGGVRVPVSGPFTDPGRLDTHTASLSCDGGAAEPAAVSFAGGAGGVSGACVFAAPGVYTLSLTVTDDDGGAGTFTSSSYVVVYDPTGGFVTGGGWIDSPAGAYAADPALAGRASFGFVSKYKPGATAPTGNTEFQFKAGNLTFHSSSYDWLVVAGARAQFKGVGTINGGGSYGFLLTAIDGGVAGSDRFRIKIWERATGAVVYDNQMGALEDSGAATALGGGSIVIHK